MIWIGIGIGIFIGFIIGFFTFVLMTIAKQVEIGERVYNDHSNI